ncbi:MAG TPA: IclR family transcriptional regulator [Pseudonocardia sp.]|nr:IclR family transcriptional regulator [Pseudonocardia sp.]
MTAPPRSTGVQSLARAFDLMELIADLGGEAGVTELSARSGLPPATIHRLVRTLVDLGYLRQTPSRSYTLGPRLIRLGETASRLIGRWATPVLTELVARFQETANLAVLDADHAVYVAQVPSPHSVRMFTEVGRRVPLYCTGVGKALLAHLPDERVEAYLNKRALAAVTPTTITDPAGLRQELDAIRLRGYAIDDGEREPGVRCVAAAVPGAPAATALSVSGPQGRISDADVVGIGTSLMELAVDLADRLNGAGGSARDRPPA